MSEKVTFDPFGEGLCCYNYENTCKDGERRLLGDGRNILFFNTKGTVNNVSKEVKAMLDYMETGKANDEMTKTLDYEVEQLHFDGPALADYLIRQMQQRTRDKKAEERGRISTLSLLVNDGTISIDRAASMANLTKDEFEIRMNDAL